MDGCQKRDAAYLARSAHPGLILLLPGMLLVLLGYGINFERSDIPMAVADFSRSDASRRYVEYYTASRDFKQEYVVQTEDEILDLIDEDLISVVAFRKRL